MGQYQVMERAHHDNILIGDALYTWGGDRSDILEYMIAITKGKQHHI